MRNNLNLPFFFLKTILMESMGIISHLPSAPMPTQVISEKYQSTTFAYLYDSIKQLTTVIRRGKYSCKFNMGPATQ